MTEKKVEDKSGAPEAKLVGKVEILIFDNGGVSVTGPLENPILMMDILGETLRTVARFAASKKPDIVSLN